MYKIRFHLAEGPHKMHWQIKGPDGTIYVNPETDQILMWKCTLRNQEKTAQKILDGAHKTVCAWIECKDYEICSTMSMPNTWGEIKFNPRKCTHWTNPEYGNIDGKEYVVVYSYDRKLFAKGMGF